MHILRAAVGTPNPGFHSLYSYIFKISNTPKGIDSMYLKSGNINKSSWVCWGRKQGRPQSQDRGISRTEDRGISRTEGIPYHSYRKQAWRPIRKNWH